mgnify:CR=1 FL=1
MAGESWEPGLPLAPRTAETLPAEPAPRKRSSAAKPATPEDAPAAKKKKGAVSTGQKQLTAFFGAKK